MGKEAWSKVIRRLSQLAFGVLTIARERTPLKGWAVRD